MTGFTFMTWHPFLLIGLIVQFLIFKHITGSTARIMDNPKKRRFSEFDELAGWPESETDSRYYKHVRNHKVDGTHTMPDDFYVNNTVTMPKPFLVDPDADAATTMKDRGDIYDAFKRTSDVSIRGIFANGEPVWGTAHYRGGMTYKGPFVDGIPHGFGDKHAGHSMYRGRFEKGMRHGRGALVDSKTYRIFMGEFQNDIPVGEFLMIMFGWSTTLQHPYTVKALLSFSDGEVVQKTETTKGNANRYSGLEAEEFMELFRDCEKQVEAAMSRKRLRDMGAEECLCTQFGVYPYSG
jgi:hypothetical protein